MNTIKERINNIYHFLWFFGEKTNEYRETFIKRFNEFIKVIGYEKAIICSIFEISKIIESTSDWISTDKGLITILKENETNRIYSKIDSFEINTNGYIFKWIENDNQWELNINNIQSSKIIIKNNWKNETKYSFINSKYGSFIVDNFIHNDRYILNISKEFIESDNIFDIWDIDNENYIINKRGTTEIYPLLEIQ